MAAGIYRIICNPTQYFYIGSCSDIVRGWEEHRRLLRKNKHENQALQDLWNSHGEHNFSFDLLEEHSDPSQMASRELYFLETLKPVLNLTNRKVKTSHAKKVTTTIRVQEDLFEQWKTAAKILRRSQSDIVIAALSEYFEKYKLTSRYELHISDSKMVLLRFEGSTFHVIEAKEMNGLSGESLVEMYRTKLNEPVALIQERPEGSRS